jgi:nitrite reductase/ring-hydroxylating ferredoxin subunit
MIRLCPSDSLLERGDGLRFPVVADGYATTGFVVRHAGRVSAFLNQCAHVAMELDWMPGRFFDSDGEYLVCSTHGALYDPGSGRCRGGACAGRGHLRPLQVVERDGAVYWIPDDRVRAPQGCE